MAILHVFNGRDRRHLSELRDKFQVVVVGARETRRCIVVDAYIPADRVIPGGKWYAPVRQT